MSSDDPGKSNETRQGIFQCSSGDNSLNQNSTWSLGQWRDFNPNDTDRNRSRNSTSSNSIGKGLHISKNGSDVIDKTTNEKVEATEQRNCPDGIQTFALSSSRNFHSLPNQSHEDAKGDKTSSNAEDLSSSVASTNPSYDDKCATYLKMNPPTAGATDTYDRNLLGRNDDTSSTRVGPKDDQVVIGTHYPPQSTPLRGRAGSVLTHDLRFNSSPYSVPICQLDMTAFTRTVIITTANRIREPHDLKSYLNWSLGGSYIENVVIDTFSGMVYITFMHEKDGHIVCQMFHDPITSNILTVRMCQQHEFDFFYDRISVHGELLRDQGFRKLLLEFLWKQGVIKAYPVIQTGCAESMILLLENTHTMNDMSRLLIDISIGFEIMVAPVTRSFIISVQWDQSLRTDDVVDYIKMKCNEANIVSIKPLNYGLLFYLRDEQSISSILSDASHIIHGLPIDARYFYPCLTAETYHRFEQNRVSCQVHVQNLTSGHYFQQSPFHRKQNYSFPTASYTYVLNHHLVQRAGQSQGYEQYLRYAGSEKREISSSADELSLQNWSQSQTLRLPPTNERPNPSSHGNVSNIAKQKNTSLIQEKKNVAIDFRQDELILLVRTKSIEDELKICSDLEIIYDLENCKVFLSGDAKSLMLTELLLQERVRTIFQHYDLTGLNDDELEILNMKCFPDKINGEFEKRKIHAHMSCENGSISILYDKGVHTARLDKVIRKFLVAREYKIEKNKILFYQSKNWSDFLQAFKDEDPDYEFSVIKLNTHKTSLLVIGPASMHIEMKAKLKQFENDNKSKTKEVIFESDLQEYAHKYFADKLKDIVVAAQNNGASVKKN
ncbi:unnamed protein product [Lymnaea stagnalis]|uniref:Uncharacterized protein n=1 Tax=Lymnaea stagnalis TaxID=6523 RepID=A0AAV2HFN0_LYMST